MRSSVKELISDQTWTIAVTGERVGHSRYRDIQEIIEATVLIIV